MLSSESRIDLGGKNAWLGWGGGQKIALFILRVTVCVEARAAAAASVYGLLGWGWEWAQP